eukprot:GFUD01128325.1.p1 GENE.GFUD01128325.1~~GFUD01128325.1.p1  ORF type:complete len:258 (-),score=59.71 GFUD01128325.1:40-813(-)
MTSQYLVYLCLVLSSCSLLSCLPAPQSSEPSETSATSSEDAYGDYEDYGDYNENTKAITDNSTTGDPLGDLFKIGGSLAQGFLALLGAKEFRDQVSRTVSTGLNLTGQIAAVAVPLVRTAVSQAPTIINASRAAIQTLGSEENQARVRQVSQGVGLVASQAPELIGQGSRLAGSVIKAANDTAPLILDGIQEFTDQLPLITGFASAYAEVNAEQAQKVAQTFYTSLQCDLQCRDVVDKDLKQECLVQFCTKEDEDEV